MRSLGSSFRYCSWDLEHWQLGLQKANADSVLKSSALGMAGRHSAAAGAPGGPSERSRGGNHGWVLDDIDGPGAAQR